MYLRVPATNPRSNFFDISLFSNFTAAEMRQKGDFWQNIAIFSPLGTFRQPGPSSCSRDPKVHLYPFLEQLDHFPQTRYDFRNKKTFKIFAASAKKWRFFVQKSSNFQRKFPKFWKLIKII